MTIDGESEYENYKNTTEDSLQLTTEARQQPETESVAKGKVTAKTNSWYD